MRTIWIVRHGNRYDFVHPEWFNNAPRKYDPPLSDDGTIQAQTLAEKLKLEPVNYIFCSPFLRAIQTAYPIAKQLNLAINIEAGLGEWHNPHWMHQKPLTAPLQQLIKQYPLIEQNYQSQIIPQYPETLEEVEKRIAKITQILITKYTHNILFVGHSISVQGMVKHLLPNYQTINTALCSVTQLNQLSSGWELKLNGDTSHLNHLPPPIIAE